MGIFDIIQIIDALSGVVVLFGALLVRREFAKVRVTLSCGVVVLRRRDLTAPNLTNIVSAEFFGGGRVPDEIRKEIILATLPKYKVL